MDIDNQYIDTLLAIFNSPRPVEVRQRMIEAFDQAFKKAASIVDQIAAIVAVRKALEG